MTYTQFIDKHGIKFNAHEVTTRPDGFMGDSAYHFKCRISAPCCDGGHAGKKMVGFNLYFSKGSGLTSSLPELADVLDCLASDASTYENSISFEDWASELGYDADSRSAEKIYRVVKRQAEQLKRTMGEEAYQELLYNTERL